MSRKIFISYSRKDNMIAMRLYADLVRSHLQVWRDQVDGDKTASFVDEFNAAIDECDDFLILDSRNYRHGSNWCLPEIKRFKDNVNGKNGREMIVCLLEPDGPWRKRFDNAEEEKYYSYVNGKNYFPFYREGIYDNDDVYQQAINSICAMYSERFIAWNMPPEVKDLEDELEKSNVALTDVDRDNIVQGYKYICRLIALNRDVNHHFRIWSGDCESYGLKLFFPRYSWCSWQANDANKGRYDEDSFVQFKRLANDFPDDPRCQFGIGAMASRLDRRREAIIAYKKVLELLERPGNKYMREHTLLEALVGLGVVLINNDQYAEAFGYLLMAYDEMLACKRFDIQLVKHLRLCYSSINNLVQCQELLSPLFENYPLENELHAQYGLVCVQLHNYESALSHLNKAYALSSSIENGLYVLFCKKQMNHGEVTPENREFALSLLNRNDETNDDSFWKAEVCYMILEDNKRAKSFLPRCNFSKFKKYSSIIVA